MKNKTNFNEYTKFLQMVTGIDALNPAQITPLFTELETVGNLLQRYMGANTNEQKEEILKEMQSYKTTSESVINEFLNECGISKEELNSRAKQELSQTQLNVFEKIQEEIKNK